MGLFRTALVEGQLAMLKMNVMFHVLWILQSEQPGQPKPFAGALLFALP